VDELELAMTGAQRARVDIEVLAACIVLRGALVAMLGPRFTSTRR
jgi:hypothetical protein